MSVISGIVTKNGRPVKNAKIAVGMGGIIGYISHSVFTDDNGRFLLQWDGTGDAAIVYCEGREVLKNVKNGSNNVHIAL